MEKMRLTIEKTIGVDSEEFNRRHPKSNIFQTKEMFQACLQTRNFDPFHFSVLDSHGKVLASLSVVIQKELSGLMGPFSSRAIIRGGPLVIDNDLEVLDFLLQGYNKTIKTKAIYSQFRNMWAYSKKEKEVFKKNGFKHEDHLDIVHDLDYTDQELFAKMHKGRRKNVRRAIKRKVRFKEINDIEDLMASLDLIKKTYKRVKLPLPDDSFFASAFNCFIHKGYAKFFKAAYDDKTIAVRLVLTFNKLIYDWYAGTDDTCLNYYPNDFLPFKVMQWGRDNDFSRFQFGGAGKPDQPYGVRDYKLKFGGDLVNLGRFERINRPILMMIAKTSFKMYQRLIK